MDVNWRPDLSSFVMLAACRRDQMAKEHSTQSNGLFTGVLLDTLESDEVNSDTTFEGLIKLVAKELGTWQKPVAYGERKCCRLWFRGLPVMLLSRKWRSAQDGFSLHRLGTIHTVVYFTIRTLTHYLSNRFLNCSGPL